MNISLPHHSVVLLVGPTGAGKSTFLEKVVEPKLLSHGVNYRILSSDGYRRQLLGDPNAHKHSSRMLEVSEQAFKLLMAELENFTAFPANVPFVFVDTRGFDVEFRKQVCAVAEKNGYATVCITFDYKNAKDYEKYLPAEEAKVTAFDVKRFRTKVLPGISKRHFHRAFTIRSQDFGKYEVELVDNNMDLNCVINNEENLPVTIIGDVHECVGQFTELVNSTDALKGIAVQIGDYLDKGGDTITTIHTMTEFMAKGGIVLHGNHEAYLYRRLKGEIEPADPEVEATYFTALKVLQEDEALRNQFFDMFEHSLPFVRIDNPNARTLYVTHAPCDNKVLGRYYDQAKREQRNFRVKDREADIRTELNFVFRQAVGNHPIHVFGHIAHASPNLVYKNKVFLDTGAVHGGKLTAMVFKDNRYDFVQIDGVNTHPSELPTNVTVVDKVEKKFNIHDYDLTPQDHKFVRKAMQQGVKYISGTMAPAPSTETELEPLAAAFDFMRKRGVESVCLQPKYMGSRCQMYLFKDPERQSFAVSRNGYIIKHVEGLDEVIADWLKKCDRWYDGMWSSIILDGELLPWSALGKGLIDHTFRSYGALVADELSELAGDEEFAKLDIAQNYDVTGRLADLAVFNETLELYAKDEALRFQAFNILYSDGEVVGGTPDKMFKACGRDVYMVADLNDPNSLVEANGFFTGLTVGRGMEGVVVKPMYDQSNPERLKEAPEYMKVRNENYLTLIYGYDYKRRYERLVRQKNISGKVAISMRESRLAMEMLTADDAKREEIIVKLISELKKEQELDPRL